ncbi:unnamed protein product [Ilex paraguariensis]|uniref:Probable purine permease n=1 Tax=Ilex paraguariensis TaxID=185542 RepID=A0ABC8UC87_9AQUA
MPDNEFAILVKDETSTYQPPVLVKDGTATDQPPTLLKDGLSTDQPPTLVKDGTSTDQPPLIKLRHWQSWLMMALNIFFLLAGQAATILLGRSYYDHGGNRDNMLYSVGLLYLSASTYSLICATQLAFNAIFSFIINHQKFTALILNSVVVLSLSASLLGVNDDSDGPSGVSNSKYILGFLCTLGASALYSLLLSLMQLSFQKVLKKETFSVVLEMLIYTSAVATCVSVVGLFASGEWRTLHGEMNGYGTGKVSYVMTLAWTAVAWQVCSVGVVGLIFVMSSLFSIVISTLSLALTPIAAVIVFHDKMNGVKVIALLMALWGFTSYIYQNHLDDIKEKKAQADVNGAPDGPSCQ